MPWVQNASPELNDISQYPTIIAVCTSLSTITAIIVGLRVWVRLRLKKSFGFDDVVIVSTAVLSIIYSGLCITQSRLGLGLPLKLRPAENLDKYAAVNFAGRPIYMAGITGFKVALCIAYLRIIHHSAKTSYRYFIWAIIIFTITSHLAGTLVLMFQCSPVKKSWRPRTPGTCLPNDSVFYALAVISILCDLVVFFTPIPLLLRIRISRSRKVGLVVVFLLGLFTTACSVMRAVQIIQISKDGNSTMLVLWGTIELNVGVSLTCLPALIPLLSFLQSKTSRGGRYAYPFSGSGPTKNSEIKLSAIGEHSRSKSQSDPPDTKTKAESTSSQEAILSSDKFDKNVRIYGDGSRGTGYCYARAGSETDNNDLDSGIIKKTVEVQVTRSPSFKIDRSS
ncbi:hypothetical protein FQN57_007114 [Myotisia sp. PD_48]|nr:hypothetical protein FQN57_007114 [Myotisia sp. PD_48]